MIECVEFKPVDNGVFRGVAKIKVKKWGVIISGCALFEKNGHRWISFPSEAYQSDDGKKRYYPFIRFEDKTLMDIFSKEAVSAIDKYNEEHSVQS